jgi:hypothetical protein
MWCVLGERISDYWFVSQYCVVVAVDSQNSNHLSVLQEHTILHNNNFNFHVYISA